MISIYPSLFVLVSSFGNLEEGKKEEEIRVMERKEREV